MSRLNPRTIVLAGPNGAGKSTIAPRVLRGALEVDHFVNADVIARGLSGFDPDSAAIAAGRILLDRLRALAEARSNFAFETTLASRTFAPFLVEQRNRGYRVHLAFVAVASPDLSIQRVADRVRRGGHDVPEETVRRRFDRGLKNLFDLYLPLAHSWQVFDNSGPCGLMLLAIGNEPAGTRVFRPIEWNKLRELAGHA